MSDQLQRLQKAHKTLRRMIDLWQGIHEKIYAALFNKELSNSERVLRVIILLEDRTTVMKCIRDLTIALLAIEWDVDERESLEEALEVIEREVENDEAQTRTAMLWN